MAKRGRPVGSGKSPEDKFVLKAFKFPPQLWEEFIRIVPKNERSEMIRQYVQKEIRRRKRRD